jgi:hypothetical protein
MPKASAHNVMIATAISDPELISSPEKILVGNSVASIQETLAQDEYAEPSATCGTSEQTATAVTFTMPAAEAELRRPERA